MTFQVFCLNTRRILTVAVTDFSCYKRKKEGITSRKEVIAVDLKNEIFAVKLCELEESYGWLQSHLRLFQGKNLEQIHQERERLQDAYHERMLLLDETAQASRSPVMARLAEIQRDYGRQTEEVLHLAGGGEWDDSPSRDRAEAMTLYAEFAIDFAVQTMRYALIAALEALELQMRADETTMKGENNKYE